MSKLCVLTVACLIAIAAGRVCTGQDSPTPLRNSKDVIEQPSNYVLGEGDRVLIDVMDAEELVELTGKELQVGSDGYLNVPGIGRVRASGLTISELQAVLTDGLRKYVREPRIFVNVMTARSKSVAVIGAVKTPGVQQLEGSKTLAQVLALAGGLSQDAGYQVKIVRDSRWGAIPLPNSKLDPPGKYSTADILVRDLTDANDPKENILVCPDDVITVPRSKLVYVIGEVKKPGGFTLGEHSSVSVLQTLALAEGLTSTASASKARVLRVTPGSKVRTETISWSSRTTQVRN